MFNRLPPWIQISACLLAINAGMINTLALCAIAHQSVSHMTGNVSILAISFLQWDWSSVLYLVLVIACFVAGSFYSGFIIGSSQVKFGRRYGTPLCLVTLFIFLCWYFLPSFNGYALLWAAGAMGMQNAMVSHYKGAIIRTTHLSGVLTDFGLSLGYWLRGIKIDKRRMRLQFLIISGFFIGGFFGGMCYINIGYHGFLVSAALTATMTMMYWSVYLHHHSVQDLFNSSHDSKD